MNRREFLAAISVAPLAAAPAVLALSAVDSNGNRIPDFSHAGFLGGGVEPPVAPVAAEVAPGGGIQSAIDRVSQLKLNADGLRGAVLLKRGEHRVAEPIVISASGVVLRGEGDSSVLVATARRQYDVVQIRGTSSVRPAGPAVKIVDEYVPVGSRSFRVQSARGFKPGDTVLVSRHGNADWIHFIAMDRIKGRPKAEQSTKQWSPFSLAFDRVITAVDGDRITVDAPIVCAIEARWGGGDVAPYRESRISRCGVEDLRAVSEFDPAVRARLGSMEYSADEQHAWNFVTIQNAVNSWARKLTAQRFGMSCVGTLGGAKWITITHCRCEDMVSQITGGRRYPYNIGGQLCLVESCTGDSARHDFAVSARVPGPNVFLECTAGVSYATSEPHHRWSVGGLYDNVKANIAVQDRQWMGSGHGWAGANYVLWNCEGSLVCQQPPGAQNWAIGHVGKREPGAFAPRPDGYWESYGKHVEPRSLYRAQLAGRLAKRS